MRKGWLALGIIALLACGAETSKPPHGLTSGPTSGAGAASGLQSSGSGDLGGMFSAAATTGSGTGGSTGCSEAATYVYVLSTDNDMYRFKPALKVFTKIGHLGCQTSMQPNSMAVDRTARAWVNYVANDGVSDTAGAIYPVSTSDASCQGGPLALTDGWYRLGMGYSSDGGNSETLFISGDAADSVNGMGTGLGKIDFASQTVKPIGPFSGPLMGQSAELTGTGDGKLYGFFTTTPVQVAQINKANGAIISTKSLPQVQTPRAWAFSFWGGDFYLYTSDGVQQTTVSRYRPSDGSVIADYMTNIGFIIVGAGVSTCAPILPPQ